MTRKRTPIEKLAYDAWIAYVFSGGSREDFLRKSFEHDAVKTGKAEPLPQYREAK